MFRGQLVQSSAPWYRRGVLKLGPIGLVELLDLRVIQALVGDVFFVESIKAANATDHLWPLVTACYGRHERFQVVVEVPLERRSDLVAQCLQVVIFVRSGPIDGESGPVAEFHENRIL